MLFDRKKFVLDTLRVLGNPLEVAHIEKIQVDFVHFSQDILLAFTDRILEDGNSGVILSAILKKAPNRPSAQTLLRAGLLSPRDVVDGKNQPSPFIELDVEEVKQMIDARNSLNQEVQRRFDIAKKINDLAVSIVAEHQLIHGPKTIEVRKAHAIDSSEV